MHVLLYNMVNKIVFSLDCSGVVGLSF